MKFKKGDITDKVWAGDFVAKCEFIDYLPLGLMLFYDKTFKCFRRVYWEYYDKKFILNGWDCASSPSKFKKI